MSDKKSFVMYESWGAAIEKMSNEQAGELIKAIYAYQKDPDAVPEDPALAWGKAKGLLTDSNLEKPVTRAELVRMLYKLKGE